MAGTGTREGGRPPSSGAGGPAPALHRWLERACLVFAGAGGLTIFAVSMAVTAVPSRSHALLSRTDTSTVAPGADVASERRGVFTSESPRGAVSVVTV